MRYLKKFNEATNWTDESISELQEFCDDYLAYLKDQGFKVICRKITRRQKVHTLIIISKTEGSFTVDEFYWADIRDYFIPFFEMLKENYETSNMLDEYDNYGQPINKISCIKFEYDNWSTFVEDDKIISDDSIMNENDDFLYNKENTPKQTDISLEQIVIYLN
jgi:hypothetical protein